MTIWYIARGAGLSAAVLLTAATCIGALLGARRPAQPGARVVLQHVHRAVASTALIVLGLHITTILADSYAHVGVVGALVPGQSGYRALWVALGSIATYSLVAVAATGFLRARMSRSPRWTAAWRAIHSAAYASWALAMLHGLRSGTDSSVIWVRWLYICCAAAVAGCVAVRLFAGSDARTGPAPMPSNPTPQRATAGAR
jgi:sulfoxide reductase heme-binding subunit YedZ